MYVPTQMYIYDEADRLTARSSFFELENDLKNSHKVSRRESFESDASLIQCCRFK